MSNVQGPRSDVQDPMSNGDVGAGMNWQGVGASWQEAAGSREGQRTEVSGQRSAGRGSERKAFGCTAVRLFGRLEEPCRRRRAADWASWQQAAGRWQRAKGKGHGVGLYAQCTMRYAPEGQRAFGSWQEAAGSWQGGISNGELRISNLGDSRDWRVGGSGRLWPVDPHRRAGSTPRHTDCRPRPGSQPAGRGPPLARTLARSCGAGAGRRTRNTASSRGPSSVAVTQA